MDISRLKIDAFINYLTRAKKSPALISSLGSAPLPNLVAPLSRNLYNKPQGNPE